MVFPGGLAGGPRAYEDQFRGFQVSPSACSWLFLAKNKSISGKRESES